MIQWYPGHMAKAKREIEANLRLVDIVVELVDARIPQSSQNPLLQTMIKDKEKIVVLMKRDLADEKRTTAWLKKFASDGMTAMAIDVDKKEDIQGLVELVYQKGLANQNRRIEKGANERPIRAMVVGIPNVGKSTLINRLAKKRIAKIGDRPGITKTPQWIKVRGKFELLDTPGVLWPKFESEEVGLKLASVGSIKYDVTPEQDVAAYLIRYALSHYEASFLERFPIQEREDMWLIFEEIGRMRGAVQSGGQINFDKVATIVLQDFRTGKLGRISLE